MTVYTHSTHQLLRLLVVAIFLQQQVVCGVARIAFRAGDGSHGLGLVIEAHSSHLVNYLCLAKAGKEGGGRGEIKEREIGVE